MMQSPRVNQSRIQCIKVKPDLLCLKQFEFWYYNHFVLLWGAKRGGGNVLLSALWLNIYKLFFQVFVFILIEIGSFRSGY